MNLKKSNVASDTEQLTIINKSKNDKCDWNKKIANRIRCNRILHTILKVQS